MNNINFISSFQWAITLTEFVDVNEKKSETLPLIDAENIQIYLTRGVEGQPKFLISQPRLADQTWTMLSLSEIVEITEAILKRDGFKPQPQLVEKAFAIVTKRSGTLLETHATSKAEHLPSMICRQSAQVNKIEIKTENEPVNASTLQDRQVHDLPLQTGSSRSHGTLEKTEDADLDMVMISIDALIFDTNNLFDFITNQFDSFPKMGLEISKYPLYDSFVQLKNQYNILNASYNEIKKNRSISTLSSLDVLERVTEIRKALEHFSASLPILYFTLNEYAISHTKAKRQLERAIENFLNNKINLNALIEAHAKVKKCLHQSMSRPSRHMTRLKEYRHKTRLKE